MDLSPQVLLRQTFVSIHFWSNTWHQKKNKFWRHWIIRRDSARFIAIRRHSSDLTWLSSTLFGAIWCVSTIWYDSARFRRICRVWREWDHSTRFGAIRHDSNWSLLWFKRGVAWALACEFTRPKTIRDAFRVNLREIIAGNFPIQFWLEKRPFRIIFGPIKGGVLRTAPYVKGSPPLV